MIPWRLKFSGIRDYTPTVMDFSGNDDHVLISGPNGAGKSTVTFCMGGVLYSSKVDLEGLKSNNLPDDQTWRASIELLFKNDGTKKVDAPLFVQFRLDIEQHPGEPVRKEFYIEEGDRIDEWDREMKFAAGGKLNFSEYKNLVFSKYAIDPDSFYLIWYQKEVNQFAVMAPEERFRIFSEMNGIDDIQKNWEESKELVKETEQSLEEAESKQRLNKMNLKQKKSELERYEDRNRRLEQGFKQYYTSLLWLEHYHMTQIQSLKREIVELKGDKEETLGERRELEIDHAAQTELQDALAHMIEQCETRETELMADLDRLKQQLQSTQEKRDAISADIHEITNRVDRIGMTEQDVKERLQEAEEACSRFNQSINDIEEASSNLLQQMNELTSEIAKLSVKIEQDRHREKEVNDLIAAYRSSNVVQDEMDQNDRRIESDKDLLRDLGAQEKSLSRELDHLRQNKLLSPRQETSLQYFARQNIAAYPLRDLLTLDDSAKHRDEQLFDAIKYTLFVNTKAFRAPTDLYHVPLPQVVPEKTITHLPEQHIKVKDGLTDEQYAFAVKALWWTRSFFIEEKPVIDKGMLVDPRGIRGPQEDQKIILSEKMLQTYQAEVEQELADIKAQREKLTKRIEDLKNVNSTLFSRRESLKDAEAFLRHANEREWQQNQHTKLKQELTDLEQVQQQAQRDLDGLKTTLAEWKQQATTYQEYQDTYAQYRQEQAKIKEVQELNELLDSLNRDKKVKNKQLDQLHDDLDTKRREQRQLNTKLDAIAENINYQDREVEQIERQIRDRSEAHVTNEESYSRTRREMRRLHESAPHFMNQFKEELQQLPEMTKPTAEEHRERGKATYDNAVNETGIDEAAPENYEKMKEAYDRSENEVKKSKILLEDYTEKMETLKEDLESTINMKIIAVNQKFVHYMSLFGFEGKIEWDMNTNRRGQIRYTLFIKARKEGHRGKVEDVSEKARGGKVGKGVSGGEESLSSLLFALALLQTIEASPGYIVLDEFDSALDEGRKDKVFELYEQELNRKMIILTPKSHEEAYLYRFSKAYVVHHNPNIPKSTIFKVKRTTGTGATVQEK
ncbi:Autophagy-related protein 23 [Lentibacillus sp. JNUCC-1]|uniref:AAA family ATPase n=1 Tax=Lentibacillus sp. JNUCC-1 TaxID=2654513 RepID=UPI0012E7A61B|nr:AAA family ATPase [Lentibacillus sp. JNUCC-1]MUV37851.1 Autophagy-related protein 23 [Lentibacillus sp. JNUCC-1]